MFTIIVGLAVSGFMKRCRTFEETDLASPVSYTNVANSAISSGLNTAHIRPIAIYGLYNKAYIRSI